MFLRGAFGLESERTIKLGRNKSPLYFLIFISFLWICNPQVRFRYRGFVIPCHLL